MVQSPQGWVSCPIHLRWKYQIKTIWFIISWITASGFVTWNPYVVRWGWTGGSSHVSNLNGEILRSKGLFIIWLTSQYLYVRPLSWGWPHWGLTVLPQGSPGRGWGISRPIWRLRSSNSWCSSSDSILWWYRSYQCAEIVCSPSSPPLSLICPPMNVLFSWDDIIMTPHSAINALTQSAKLISAVTALLKVCLLTAHSRLTPGPSPGAE